MNCTAVAWLGLGSNLESPAAQVDAAVDALAAMPDTRLLGVSARYRSASVGGPPNQPDFCNACAALAFDGHARALLARLQAIEAAHGRVRDVRWGPRTLDVDILAVDYGYAMARSDDPFLTLPHPRIEERAFVIVPLADIAPVLVLRHGQRVIDRRAELDRSDIEPWRAA